jgi:hypothetical protein
MSCTRLAFFSLAEVGRADGTDSNSRRGRTHGFCSYAYCAATLRASRTIVSRAADWAWSTKHRWIPIRRWGFSIPHASHRNGETSLSSILQPAQRGAEHGARRTCQEDTYKVCHDGEPWSSSSILESHSLTSANYTRSAKHCPPAHHSSLECIDTFVRRFFFCVFWEQAPSPSVTVKDPSTTTVPG